MEKTGRQVALEVIYRVNEEGAYSNLALNQLFNKYSLAKREKPLATELVYGSLRWRNTLDWILKQFADRKLKKMDKWSRNILRLGVYQLLFLDGIPVSAACNESVELAKQYQHQGAAGFVNGILRNLLRELESLAEVQFPNLKEDPVQHIRYRYSFPQWLVEIWVKKYGVEETIELCQAFNQRPTVTIRSNSLCLTAEQLRTELEEAGLEVELASHLPQLLKLKQAADLTELAAFKQGKFQIQGAASLLTTLLLAPQPGQRVLDLCSAPGGKTTHLAELMENQGQIVANELHEHRLELVKRNCARLRVEIVEPSLADGRNLAFEQSFDKILVDAPCSGLGMIAKKPELKWQQKPQDVQALSELQLELLLNASQYLKPGGELIYSTCTITEEENWAVVEQLLAQRPDLEIVDLSSAAAEFGIPNESLLRGALSLLPSMEPGENEGYFIVKLKQSAELDI
ncbi:16S rRNA (cytosine(967)-C(5))-methyltransferase RsmB [Fuchsiella alkaliacetigena]|uniref:16S rRNA (cytosine(967)-C(5))-methyltransferase RsmB n=1 Tax=Fuchsiella alkaliacetigena TaxID=957042 RepID=UPI00200B006C|nr:16S rRNA (cytosine(967)-C(5))-methyltransferase RsmB [Fuchsiella alkaliacetigena]MCK8823616.1 16S rRNA (cytosine(967)-C(5))-methyltransferase RsmB [Fuchsiella alkaliacetigena]